MLIYGMHILLVKCESTLLLNLLDQYDFYHAPC
jgi:hypothetical protein